VAPRTTRLSKEKTSATFWIAREFNRCGSTLQVAQVVNNRLNLRGAERTKRWHPGSRFAVMDNAEKRLVRQLLDFAFAGNIGPALSASSVQTMTGRATAGKDSLTFGDIAIFRRWGRAGPLPRRLGR
jgi:hypothetical protein